VGDVEQARRCAGRDPEVGLPGLDDGVEIGDLGVAAHTGLAGAVAAVGAPAGHVDRLVAVVAELEELVVPALRAGRGDLAEADVPDTLEDGGRGVFGAGVL